MLRSALLSLAFPCPAPQDVPPRFLERTIAAYEALDHGELPRAKQLFEANLERFPSHANSAYALACVEARSGNVAPALDWLAKAVELGWADADVAVWDEDLKALRGEERFEVLVAAMRAQADAPKPDARLVCSTPNDFPTWSADGTRILAGNGGEGAILDANTNELVSVATQLGGGISGRGFAPNGLRFFVSLDPGPVMWDALYGKPAWRFGTHTSGGGSEWSRDGARLLAHGAGGDCVLFDVERGARISDFGLAPLGAWLSPNGTRVLALRRSGSREAVGSVRDAATGNEFFHFDVAGTPAFQGGFSESGRFVWCCSVEFGEVHVFDATDGRERHVLKGSNGILSDVIALPDRDVLVTAGGGRGLTWWDLTSGEPVKTVAFDDDGYGSMLTSSDGRFLMTSRWGDAIRVWDAREGVELWHLDATRSSSWSFGATFSGDGERLVLPLGDALRVYESRTGKELRKLGAPSLGVAEPALDPDGKYMIVPCDSGELRVIELGSARTTATWKVHGGCIDTCTFLGDGDRLLVGWRDGTVAILDGRNGTVLHSIERHLDADWTKASATHDGRRIVAWSGPGDCELLDAENGSVLAKIGLGGWGRTAVIDEHTRRLAAERTKGVIGIWNVDSGEPEAREFAAGHAVRTLAFSADGALLACGTDGGGVFVWRVADGALLREHKAFGIFDDFKSVRDESDMFDDSVTIRDVGFEADAHTLVFTTGDSGSIRRLYVEAGVEKMIYDFGGGNPSSLMAPLSASGKRLYVYGNSGGGEPVRDAWTGAALLVLHGGSVRFADGTRDDRWVIGTVEHGVRVFGEKLDSRYTYIPFEDGGWIAKAESLHCAGTAEALRWAVVVIGDETYPFASFAAQLLDPKRVRAAAAGVNVRPVKLGTPPTVRAVGEPIRSIGALDDTVAFEVELTSSDGFGDCEGELDGKPIDELRELFASLDVNGEPLRVALAKHRKRTRKANELRLVVYDRAGIGSRPLRMRFVPGP